MLYRLGIYVEVDLDFIFSAKQKEKIWDNYTLHLNFDPFFNLSPKFSSCTIYPQLNSITRLVLSLSKLLLIWMEKWVMCKTCNLWDPHINWIYLKKIEVTKLSLTPHKPSYNIVFLSSLLPHLLLLNPTHPPPN